MSKWTLHVFLAFIYNSAHKIGPQKNTTYIIRSIFRFLFNKNVKSTKLKRTICLKTPRIRQAISRGSGIGRIAASRRCFQWRGCATKNTGRRSTALTTCTVIATRFAPAKEWILTLSRLSAWFTNGLAGSFLHLCAWLRLDHSEELACVCCIYFVRFSRVFDRFPIFQVGTGLQNALSRP